MKKLLTLLTICVLVLSVAACAEKPAPGSDTLEGSLEDILDQIYASEGLREDFKAYAKDGLMVQEITADNMEYHLGKTGLEFEEGIASEPMMMPSAYSLCLIRAGEGVDVDELKQEIKNSANPMKWVCVGVDPDNVIVDSIGDVIILIMSDTDAQDLHEAFLALSE